MTLHSKIRAAVAVGLSLVVGGTALGDAISLVPNYTDGPSEGFNEPVVGAQRRAAFEYALGIWSGILNASYTGETIVVDAAFNNLGGSSTSAVLGSAGSTFLNRDFGGTHPEYLTNTWYGAALANHMQGADGFPTNSEISSQYNTDVDDSTVLGTTDWYYGTDGNNGSDIDFVTVALHELAHGLNISAVMNSSGAFLEFPGGSGAKPGIYDRFLEDAGGTDLTAMASDAARASAIRSTDLFWNGANGALHNGGVRPELYAPTTYAGGSSVSHLDEATYGNELTSPFYSGPDHEPSNMERGMLDDMGWDVNYIPEPASLAAMGLFGLMLLRRRAA